MSKKVLALSFVLSSLFVSGVALRGQDARAATRVTEPTVIPDALRLHGEGPAVNRCGLITCWSNAECGDSCGPCRVVPGTVTKKCTAPM